MRSLVLAIIPVDAPDPHGMLEEMLKPFQQDHNIQRCSWPYWDYWLPFNMADGVYSRYLHDCSILVSEIPQETLFTAIYTPDGEMYDCNCPAPTASYDDSVVHHDFERHCRHALTEYYDHLGIPLHIHT